MSDATRTPINPDSLAAPGGHYSHGVTVNGLVFVSGQLPIAPDGRKLADESFERQALQVMVNVESILKAAGSGLGELVQVRVYVTNIDHWPEFNDLYARWLGECRPARCVVPVPSLHYGFLVEMEAVARLAAPSSA